MASCLSFKGEHTEMNFRVSGLLLFFKSMKSTRDLTYDAGSAYLSKLGFQFLLILYAPATFTASSSS